MAVKNRRIEARATEADETLINEGAELAEQTVSTFVIDAARKEATRLVARADTTIMPAEQFDVLIAALDEPDEAPRLAELARRPRRFTRP